MIIEAEKQVIGILVDSVAEVVYLRSSEIDSTPSVGTEESAKFIQGVSNRDGELLILVDLNKLLSDEEWMIWRTCNAESRFAMVAGCRRDTCRDYLMAHGSS